MRCTGTGSPTLVMEGGDGNTSDSYAFAEPSLAKVTRTCVYDRANLGRSDPAPGPRGLGDLVGDLERLLDAAEVPGPYVLVGTSGGGLITAGYAVAHPKQVAGMVFIDTGPPFENPPREIVEETDPTNPANVWLVLSLRAKQIVAHTSHAVEEDDPEFVIDVIRDVVTAAQ